jgi:Flp pilus assembly protein TadD
VLRDPFIRSWRLIPEGFRHFLFTDATASNFYRPVQRLTYTWDYAWFAFAPWGWHLTNILLHAAAAVMLFLFLEKVAFAFTESRRSFSAAISALIWAIHPLQTSAVCYVAGRADLLAALFAFSGLYLAMRKTRAATLGAALSFLCAMLSKESGATVLLIWLALLLFKQQKIWRWLIVTVVVTSLYALLRFSAQHETPPQFTPPPSLAARPILAARAWAEYAGLLIAPVHLHMERDVLPFGHGDLGTTVRLARWREFQTLLGVALIGAFIAWARWAKRRESLVFTMLFAFLLAYLPISNLFPLNANVAEHWLYFPCAFLFATAVWTASRIPLSKPAGMTLLLLWLGFLAWQTFTRNFDWRDQRTFLERNIAEGGDSARMLINLGLLETAENHPRIAIGHFTNALQRSPDQPFALLGLANAYLHERDFDQAREQLAKAEQNSFVRPKALQDLARLEFIQHGTHRLDLLREAVQLAPDDWSIQQVYVKELADAGQLRDAISYLRDLTERQPFRAESWRLLGDLWTMAKQPDSAQRAYQRAAALDVHDTTSREKLQALARS